MSGGEISVPVRSSIEREVATSKGVSYHEILHPPTYSKTCAKDDNELQEPKEASQLTDEKGAQGTEKQRGRTRKIA
jgi:hypothetical protein